MLRADPGAGPSAAATPQHPTPVALDAMGGDLAPAEPVAAAVSAVRDHGVPVVLVGRRRQLEPLVAAHGATDEIQIVHADDVIAMDEGALAIRRKPRSSVAVGCRLVRHGLASGLISAGSTGGVVATARLRLRGLHGVPRPALAVVLPTRPEPTVLLDAGATADAKPEMLVQFAHLGVAYAQLALGIAHPRVGLLTIGAEPGKGSKLARRAHDLLAAAPIEFAGNVEGGDLLAGRVPVVVTDGFTGNVALKTIEGTTRYVTGEVLTALTGGIVGRAWAATRRRRLAELRDHLGSAPGGAALLGLAGTVVIAHGASRAPEIASACLIARDLAGGAIVDRIRDRVGGERRISLRR